MLWNWSCCQKILCGINGMDDDFDDEDDSEQMAFRAHDDNSSELSANMQNNS